MLAPKLAIVSPDFNQVSETFVADHARSLAPGRTVLVCTDSRGAERFGHPVLSHVSPPPAAFGPLGRLRGGLEPRVRRAFGFGSTLSFDARTRVIDFFRTQGVTVVLAEFGNQGVLVADPCRLLGLPLYVCFRGHDATEEVRWATMRRFYRRLFRQAAGIIAESRYLADRLAEIGCPEAKLHVNPSGMDPEQYRPGRPEPGRILAIGRLVEMKAPQLTLAAFARIAGRFPEAHLDMVGAGPLQAACEAVIREQGLGARVTLHGAQSHDACATLSARAAMFVQHSVTTATGQKEGFPVAISEAMAAQLPVISTLHSGIPEHVQDGVTGLLVAEGDVEAMAAAMARLLADPGLAAAMGRAGRDYALANLTRTRARANLWRIMDLEARLAPLISK